MLTRRVRILLFFAVSIIAFVAAFAIANNEEVSLSVKIAIFIIGIYTLAEPIQIIYGVIVPNKSASIGDEMEKLQKITHQVWVKGVLADALLDSQIDIAVSGTPEQVGASQDYQDYQLYQPPVAAPPSTGIMHFIKTILRQSADESQSIPNTPQAVARAFNDVGKKLLIMGEPGSGKTILLLQLAQHLLTNAANNSRSGVPVVFNLSGWAVKRGSIEGWILDELRGTIYGLSQKAAWQFVNTDRLIYLLDGLDEVSANYRNECVKEINKFNTPDRQLVICCRIEEYRLLSQQLDLNYAIEMLPLSGEDFAAYLASHIASAQTVRAILSLLQRESDIWHEANKPLFLNILISTYRDGKPFHEQNMTGNTIKDLQRTIIEPYITRQLQMSPSNAPFANESTRRYLSWLGWQMRREFQTTFYIDMIQMKWLDRGKRDQFAYITALQGITILAYGILSSLLYGPIFGVILGIGTGISYAVRGFEDLSFSAFRWRFSVKNLPYLYQNIPVLILSSLAKGICLALGIAIVGGVLGGIIGALASTIFTILLNIYFFTIRNRVFGRRSSEFYFRWFRNAAPSLFLAILFGGLYGGMTTLIGSPETIGILYAFSDFFSGLIISGFTDYSDKRDYTHPGAVLRDGLIYRIFAAITAGLGRFLFFGLNSGIEVGLIFSLFTIILNFIYILISVIAPFLIHLILFSRKVVPSRFDQVLHYGKNRRFLRQVGNGYVFIHRYILDYFADYYEANYLHK